MVFVMPEVMTAPLSIFTDIVAGSTPESSSVTVHVIAGLLFVIVAPAVGAVIVIVGATFSFTLSCKLVPSVASVASFVTLLPAVSVAVTVTG